MRKVGGSGFTLLEVLIATTVAILVAAAMLPNYPQMFNQKRADVTVARILTMSEAAQAFITDTASWPDQANNCADALTALQNGGYITGVNATSPWQTPYAFACPAGAAGAFNISVASISPEWAEYMLNTLPAATMNPTSGSGPRTVAGSFPRPATLSSSDLNDVLWRTDQSASGQPQRNRMDYQIDMNDNDINNADEIGWGSSRMTSDATGDTIELGGTNATAGVGNPRIDFHVGGGAASSFDMRMVATNTDLIDFIGGDVRVENLIISDLGNKRLSEGVYDVAVVAPEDVIPKPACLAAGTTPKIYLALAEFGETSDADESDNIVGAKVQAVESLDGTSWIARFFVTTPDGTVDSTEPEFDPAVNKAIAVVKCAT